MPARRRLGFNDQLVPDIIVRIAVRQVESRCFTHAHRRPGRDTLSGDVGLTFGGAVGNLKRDLPATESPVPTSPGTEPDFDGTPTHEFPFSTYQCQIQRQRGDRETEDVRQTQQIIEHARCGSNTQPAD